MSKLTFWELDLQGERRGKPGVVKEPTWLLFPQERVGKRWLDV